MYRARIDGAIFGEKTYIGGMRILDTEIKGSINFQNSLVLDAAIDGLELSGEMRLSGSALSYLVIQFSRIGGMLDISMTEARCAYLLKKNEIGELFAADFGFGKAKQITMQGGAQKTAYDWSEKRDHPIIRPILERPDVRQTVRDSDDCYDPHESAAEPKHSRDPRSQSEFVLFDNRVNSSLCLTSFNRLRRDPAQQAGSRAELLTSLVINYASVGNYIIMNLGMKPSGAVSRTKLAFQSVGLETRSLILNFSDLGAPEMSFIDGLRFDRVYAARKDIDCPHKRFTTLRLPDSRDAWDKRRTGFLNESDDLKIPTVDQVTAWLRHNQATTVQPFTAFIEAFEKSGVDSLQLRIERARKDLSQQWLQLRPENPRKESASQLASREKQEKPGIRWASVALNEEDVTFHRWISHIGQSCYLTLMGFWGWIADFGYRPLKALPIIPVVLLVFGTLFWFGFGVVGYKPQHKKKISPIGILFLFDRLIPLYNIRQEHYQIEAFYQRASKASRNRSQSRDSANAATQPATMASLTSQGVTMR